MRWKALCLGCGGQQVAKVNWLLRFPQDMFVGKGKRVSEWGSFKCREMKLNGLLSECKSRRIRRSL